MDKPKMDRIEGGAGESDGEKMKITVLEKQQKKISKLKKKDDVRHLLGIFMKISSKQLSL